MTTTTERREGGRGRWSGRRREAAREASGEAATTSEASPPAKEAGVVSGGAGRGTGGGPGVVVAEEGDESTKTYFSVAKMISRKFGSGLAANKRLSGTALFASKPQGSQPESLVLAKRGGTTAGRRGVSFVHNLESLWRPLGGSPAHDGSVALGWYDGWGWDEVKGNFKTFSNRQRRKLEEAINKTQEEFALKDLLNRSNVPIRKYKRSMSETELQLREQMSAEEAAALKIQKYVNYRVGKNLNLYQQGKDMASSWLDESSSSSPRNAAAKTKSQSYFSGEDFEPLVRASATLKTSLAEFSSSFQEIASKAKSIEGASLVQSCQDRVESALENGYPRLSRAGSPTSSSSSSGARTDVVVPWGVLPGVLRAWEKSVDELALQITQKQLEASGKKRRKRGRHQNVSLKDNGNFVNIFTTASLPWMTGTAVNPLLRAAYLSRLNKKVTLVVPWLSLSDQRDVYPHNIVFNTPEQQEAYVMDWIKRRVPFEPKFRIKFYPSMYAKDKGSLLPIGDITGCVPDREADIAILEEPEHLNWYHPGRRWNKKFQYVVGIVHTNYLDYVSREEGGNLKKNFLKSLNSLVCRAYCDKVIKLSGAVQHLPKSEICNVHGVSPKFLETPVSSAGGTASLSQAHTPPPPQRFTKGVYFMGKALWAKGYSELLDLLARHKQSHGSNVDLDVYGSGPDFDDIVDRANKTGLSLNFLGAKDHQDGSFRDYKVFVNPSLSDVVATTTAEALAMGKFVIVAEHPSNHFFAQFPNCLVYKTEAEFSECLTAALSTEPRPLSDEDRHRLTWEAATERLISVAEPGRRRNLTSQALDQLSWTTHHVLACGVSFFDRAFGSEILPNDKKYKDV